MHTVFLSIRELPESCRPCLPTRVKGMTHVAIHPGTDRATVIGWVVDNLTVEERNAIRAALDIGPVGTALPDWTFDCGEHVPLALQTAAERRRTEAALGLLMRQAV